MADLIATKYIARKEVKAVQRVVNGSCIYTPHVDSDKNWIKWSRADLLAHLSGERSYGHYLLNTNDQCKLFSFDIDLEKTGSWPTNWEADPDNPVIEEINPREAWRNRRHPARKWLKIQLKSAAFKLASHVYQELEIPVAVYYSGSKGLHVYGFTGLIPAHDAREGARIALESTGAWEPKRGDSFFMSKDQDPFTGHPCLSVEVYPKQDTLGASGLGNLMRLPLGRNLKNPKDPTFFLDLRNVNMTDFAQVDAAWALTATDAWSDSNG